jgi:murein DD-endopeptidase MepM/ murein hydrolase activator NlpD
MRRLLIVLLIIFLAATAITDELSDKQKQLQNVQSQLQKAQKQAQDTASKKQKAQGEIQRTTALKRRTDQNLSKLRSVESTKRDSLDRVHSRLEDAEQRLTNLEHLQNHNLEMLIRADRSYSGTDIRHRDQRLLSIVAEHNELKLTGLKGYRTALTHEKALKQSEFSQAVSEVRKTSRESSKMQKTLSSLKAQSSKLAREEKRLQNQIAKLKKDAAQLESLISRLTASSRGTETASYQFTGNKIAWPVRGRIIRSFGSETRAYGTSVTNQGIDIAVAEGTAVKAADAGEVIFADRYSGQGNLVIIDHKNGFFTVYAYNSSINVSVGSKVSKGQVIARSGSTGSATEPSLHFELRKDGKSIDPMRYLE